MIPALAASMLLAAPSVSAPIHLPSGPLEPAPAASPVLAAWDGTAFQLARVDAPYALLSRLSPSGVPLDDTGNPVPAFGAPPLALACNSSDCLLATPYIYGRVVSHSALLSGTLTLTDFTVNAPLALDWDGAHYLMLWVNQPGQLRASRFSAAGAPLDGTGGIGLGPASFSTSSGAQVSCLPTQCLAMWMTLEGTPPNQNLYAARVATDGGLLDAVPLLVAGTPDDDRLPSVANDGAAYLAAWMRAPLDGGLASMEAARIDADGGVTSLALTGGARPGAYLDQGPCVGYDGAQFRLAWLSGPTDVLDGTRISSAGTVLDDPPVALTLSRGGVGSAVRCASGGGAVLVTYADSLPLGASTDFGVLLAADGGVRGPVELAVTAAAQSRPSLSGDGHGFKLVWTEQTAASWRVRGVDFGAGGFSTLGDVVPQALNPSSAAVRCDGACLLAWLEGASSPTLHAGYDLGLGSPRAGGGVGLPTLGEEPVALTLASDGHTSWGVMFVSRAFRLQGAHLSPALEHDGGVVVLDDAPAEFAGITAFSAPGTVTAPDAVFIGYSLSSADGGHSRILRATPDLTATVLQDIGALDPQSLSWGSQGLVAASADVTDAGAGEYITLFDDAGAVSQRWPIGIGGTAAIAFDGQHHLAVGTYHDAGSAWVLGQVLASNGQPMGTPFTLLQTGVYSPRELVAAAMTQDTFSVAYSLFDPSRGVYAQRLSVQLVSLNGLAEGTPCSAATDCASFDCQGVCVAAPDGGFQLSFSDAGAPDAGGADAGADDAGAQVDAGPEADAGAGLDAGGPAVDGGVFSSDRFGVSCGCDAAGVAPALLLLLLLGAFRGRRRSPGRPAR